MNLYIEYFKCFINGNIHLNNLTVLAGANATGKSTTIQALLLLRQTIELCGALNREKGIYEVTPKYFLNRNIPLNGEFLLSLGNSSDILNQLSDKNILICFNENNNELSFEYEADSKIAQLWMSINNMNILGDISNFPITKHEFYYLCAERLGPRIQQNINFFDYLNTGWQGEYTAQVIDYENGLYKIDEERMFPNSKNSYMNNQLNLWLDFIFPGIKVKSSTNPKTLTSQIMLENTYTISEPTISTNLGFGISYVLPIITTGLIAKKGSYMVIENPEAHLHPSAQSKLGRFLSIIADKGVNVIIETHSDHILSGIQIAAVSKEINPDLIVFNYFNSEEGNLEPEIIPITISNQGELSVWPKGFFDQIQSDYLELYRNRNLNK